MSNNIKYLTFFLDYTYLLYIFVVSINSLSARYRNMERALVAKLKYMEFIRYYHNHNTGECKVWFGIPFLPNCPLWELPKEKDGKIVHVLGLQPYTVELEINIRPDKADEAYLLTNNSSFIPRLIDHLKSIAI